MSFLTVVEQDLGAAETVAVNAAKDLVNYIENVTVTELIPALEKALLAAIGSVGQDAVAAVLASVGAAPSSPDTTPAS